MQKNDFNLLPLQQLAKDYQEAYNQLKTSALDKLHNLLLDRWQREVHGLVQYLDGGSEAGTDGLVELAQERYPQPQKPTELPEPQQRQLLQQAREEVVEPWFLRNQISAKMTWLPFQQAAYFATWTPYKNSQGKYCPELTYNKNVVEPRDLFALGSVIMAKADRDLYFKDAPKTLPKQYASPLNPFVPIVLSAFKRHHKIPYMAWDLSKISRIENALIASFRDSQAPELTTQEILELRLKALTPVTGKRAGIPSNAATTFTLFHLSDTPLRETPKYVRHQVLQTWCCHPQNRTEYMILDPQDWDRMPKPLVGATDVFAKSTYVAEKYIATNYDHDSLPWDA